MVSIITAQSYAHVPNSHKPISNLSHSITPSLNFTRYPPKKPEKYKKASKSRHFRFVEVDKACDFDDKIDGSMCCSCKNYEGDAELEAEILEYMSKSSKPTMFPTKAELLRSGRLDLVEAIKMRGGWYSLGWDDEDDEIDNGLGDLEFDVAEFNKRVEYNNSGKEGVRDDLLDVRGRDDDFDCEVNGSARKFGSLELATEDSSVESDNDEEETGVAGILSRLEKQRNNDFGINLERSGHESHTKSKDRGDGRRFESFSARTDLDEISRHTPRFDHKGALNSANGRFGPNNEPEDWRNWSNHRAGFQEIEFEAAEIYFPKNEAEHDRETYGDVTTNGNANANSLDGWDGINHSHIRARLQHLELELNSTLLSLKSKREDSILNEVTKSSDELHNLSDAYEFQENEIMSAHERLRSIRAKLAVIEGKMTLAIMDAQKIAEDKQKRIDSARKALQLLRTTCIVWPNSASEVLLAGSFDGWSTQRKMEKSTSGIFSVCLKLYPGKYEIKFIVDGIWRTDPLRPIVNNSGYENNLLIVT